ncbi:MAG: alginate export family protein [Candidatus Dadabacteria bacterium]|nr:alginate export family protein [Candidatus Dadabacteria bacterium]
MKINRKLFSLFTIVFLLTFCVTESNGQSNSPQDEEESAESRFDPDAPPETKIKIAPFLTFGAQIGLEYVLERNLDLDGDQDEDLSTIAPELSVAFSFDPSRYFQAFFNVESNGEFIFEDGDKVDDQVSLEIVQAYILFKNLLGERLSIQLGRQRFDDERQWLYDAELDAGRVFLRLPRFLLELSVSRGGLVDRDLLNFDPAGKINNYIAYGTYAIAKEIYASPYVVIRDDRSGKDESSIFLGLHSDGEITDSLEYWLELAYLWGKDGSNNINGLGFDLGSIYVFNLPLEPSITLSYAFGSNGFRQTGLQANEGGFNGATDFLYYGELFDPELSNLSIFTAGAGIKLTEESSIDLVYHYYLQDKASDSLRDVGIDAEPDGRSKRLGSEIDLVLGYATEEIKNNIELALVLGYFIPDKAFPESQNSFLTKVIIQFEF